VLRPAGDSGFGLIKFRQPNDADRIVYLDVWVRDLAPSTDYSLQRAVDFTVDGNCTSSGWLTLGRGLQPQPITTDLSGTGHASLFRDLGAFAPGLAIRHSFPGDRRDDVDARAPERVLPVCSESVAIKVPE
jgi:hypothetical protein